MMFAIVIAKLVACVLHLFGKGATTLPGKIALTIKYNILNRLSKGVHIICVTGTNGKTTTCALLEQGIKASGKSYFINKSGANMITGVATAFIMNSTVFGKCKKEYAILECDENSFPNIARYIDADIVVVTNIFRDQLDRYGEIEHTLNKIVEAITYMPLSTVVLNADCPMTYYISRLVDNDIIRFGINAEFGINAVSDVNYCPVCASSLSYRRRIYSQLGDFYCSSCGYSRVKPDNTIDDIIEINENGSSFFMNNRVVGINLGGIFNVYNFLSAYTALCMFGINSIASLVDFNGSFGRMERFSFDDKEIIMMLVKNPVGFANCISYAVKLKGSYDFVFALNDNDADGTDVSWIWDVDFTPLKYKAEYALTTGTRAYDMALRLKYDDITADEIILSEDYSLLIEKIKSRDNNCIVFSSYTAMMNMRHFFISEFGGSEFWE